MKIHITQPHEDWCVDDLARTLRQHLEQSGFEKVWHPDDADDADIIHLLSDWTWRKTPRDALSTKPVVCTVHHIYEPKFGPAERADFAERDQFVDAYHVFNARTEAQVRRLTMKPVHLIPYWLPSAAEQEEWRDQTGAAELRASLGIHGTCIFSAQRDTEGAQLQRGELVPKMEKGPDTFVDAVIREQATRRHGKFIIFPPPGSEILGDVHVLLAGPRREFVRIMLGIHAPDIRVVDLGVVPQHTLRMLYHVCDEYWVTSRGEGGPQALIEAGMAGCKVRSTPVGIAEQVLPAKSINQDILLAEASVPDVSGLSWDVVGPKYLQLYREVSS